MTGMPTRSDRRRAFGIRLLRTLLMVGLACVPILGRAAESGSDLAWKIRNPVARAWSRFLSGTTRPVGWGRTSRPFLLQLLLKYNFPHDGHLSNSPIMTADWSCRDDAWLIPVGSGFGKVHRFGKLPLNLSTQAFCDAERHRGGGIMLDRCIASLIPSLAEAASL